MDIAKRILLLAILFSLGCEEGGLLIEPDISERQVNLISPRDGVEVASNTIFFDWEPVEEATRYEIQVATPDFDNTQQLLLNVTDSVTVNQLDLTLGDYQWRVRAKNSNYETAYTTASFRVVAVENFSDNIVQLLAPSDNFITNNTQQLLTWEAVEGATLYRIQVLENGALIDEQATNDPSLEYTFGEGVFIWQVRAENGTDNTLYSSRDILIDTTAPNIASLLSPEDGMVLTAQTVSFNWNREPLSGSTEFDSIYVYNDMDLTNLVLKEQANPPYETDLTNDTYYWQVKAFDEAGNEGEGSTVFTFDVNQ
ncbi:MAG: hypothetical protein AAFP76_00035 [Bacteroidota bacterium]